MIEKEIIDQLGRLNPEMQRIVFINTCNIKEQLDALSEDPFLVGHITSPSEAMWWRAVSSYPHIIGLINNPSNQICDMAIKKDPSAIYSIKNPSEQHINQAFQHERKLILFMNAWKQNNEETFLLLSNKRKEERIQNTICIFAKLASILLVALGTWLAFMTMLLV